MIGYIKFLDKGSRLINDILLTNNSINVLTIV
jgi:hypothetical protein